MAAKCEESKTVQYANSDFIIVRKRDFSIRFSMNPQFTMKYLISYDMSVLFLIVLFLLLALHQLCDSYCKILNEASR